jgi:hypothetical protein
MNLENQNRKIKCVDKSLFTYLEFIEAVPMNEDDYSIPRFIYYESDDTPVENIYEEEDFDSTCKK